MNSAGSGISTRSDKHADEFMCAGKGSPPLQEVMEASLYAVRAECWFEEDGITHRQHCSAAFDIAKPVHEQHGNKDVVRLTRYLRVQAAPRGGHIAQPLT